MLTNSKPVILVPTIRKEESKQFYENVLGLKFRYDDGFAMVFDSAGIMLRITPVKEFSPHEFSVLSWEVEDISAAAAGLTERGAVFERYDFPWMEQDEQCIWSAPDGTMVAWFKDPDDNLLSIVQHAPKPTDESANL